MRPARALAVVTEESAEVAVLRREVSDLRGVIERARKVAVGLHEASDEDVYAQMCLGTVMVVLERALYGTGVG